MKIADLFAEVGFKFDSIKLREVGKLIGDLNVSSIVGATSVTALGVEIKKLIDDSAQLSSSLKTISANTGINPQFVQQFEAISQALGSSKEDATAFLSTLSKIQFNVMMGKGGEQPFLLAGIPFEKIIGKTEDLAKEINRVLSKPIENADAAGIERRKRFLSFLNQGFGSSAQQLKVLSNPDVFEKMHEFNALNTKEIQDSTIATYEWQKAVHNINVEFEKMAIVLLPEMTSALKDFANDGGLKGIMDTIKGTGEILYKLELIGGIGSNYIKTGMMKMADRENQVKLADLREQKKRERAASVSVSTGPITVHSSTPEEFVKRFDAVWKKYISSADLQFGQQT